MYATLPQDAQYLLDQANALFPGRYEARTGTHGRTCILDTHRSRDVAFHRDPLQAAKKALQSARLSANNGNRQHPHGHEPKQLTLQVPHAAHARLQAEAKERGLTVQEWAVLKLSQ